MNVLYAFGLNDDGQCYSAAKVDHQSDAWSPILVRFPSLVQIVSVSAGSRHSLALSADGHVYSWGWGRVGQLGHGECVNAYQPRRIAALSRPVRAVSAGGMHSACITVDHHCYTWGSNTYGQLGIGKSFQGGADEVSVPLPSLVQLLIPDAPDGTFGGHSPVPGSRKGSFYSSFLHTQSGKTVNAQPFLVSKLSCGGCHTGAITLDGQVYCWGKADSGQTGCAMWYLGFSPGIYSPHLVAPFLPDGDRPVDISCGGFYTLILTQQMAVYGMGKEDFGCLGMLCEENTETPHLLSALHSTPIASLAAGGWHSMLVSETGDLYACGKGEYGRLGLGSDASSLLPTKVLKVCSLRSADQLSPLEQTVLQVSAGGAHSLFHTGSRVYAVGRLDNGRCANKMSSGAGDRSCYGRDITAVFYKGSIADVVTIAQVAAGGAHSLVLVRYEGLELDEGAAPLAETIDAFLRLHS